MKAPWMAAALLALAAAAPAHAQPCGTRTGGAPTLTAGQTVRGSLAREDFSLPGDRFDGTDPCTGRPYDAYFYEAQAGERLTFVLESRQIDPEITATTSWRGGGTKDVADQRGRRGRPLTVTGVVPATGRILIQVASNVSMGRRGAFGDYTFTVRSDRAGGGGQRGGRAEPAPAAGGSTLRLGQSASGALDASDGRLTDESYFEDFTYTARRGERLVATLSSDDFDAFLHVGRRAADGSLENAVRDDDSGGGTNARAEYTADRDGPVTLRVNTLGSGESGRFTIQVQAAGGPAPAPEPAPQGEETAGTDGLPVLRLGRPVQGELTQSDGTMDDGSYFDDYHYQGRRGERLVVRLSSDDFDAVLGVIALGADGSLGAPILDDDGGGGTNSRVEYTVQRDGPVVIRANSLSARETGTYTLVVESASRGAAAPAPASARRVASAASTGGGRTALAGSLASASPSFAARRPFRADPLGAGAHTLRAPAFATRRADPMTSRSTPWLMAGLGIGMIFAGAAIEDTPVEPVGALIRYTGYAFIVFAPFSGGS